MLSSDPFSPTVWFYAALLSASFALCLWWIRRLQQQWRSFPLVRIFIAKRPLLPPLSLKAPAWPPFLLFACLSTCFCLLCLKPANVSFKPLGSQKLSYHVYLDMSASLEAHSSIEAYANRVANLWSSLPADSTISTSHSNQVWNITDAQTLKEKLLALGFHRTGSVLAQAYQQQSKKIGHKDQLIIVSDRDAHTWQDFSWQYFQNESEVWFYDLFNNPSQNVYFNQLAFRSEPGSPLQDWDVTLVRTAASQASLLQLTGQLKVSYAGKTLASQSWQFAAEQTTLTLRLSWPRADLKELSVISQDGPTPLLWELSPDITDALISDNSMRSGLGSERQPVLIIAKSAGEQKLAAPALALHTSMEALGFSPTRMEEFFTASQLSPTQPEENSKTTYPLWILFQGKDDSKAASCPLLSHMSHKGALQNKLQIWLSPYSNSGADLAKLCTCYHRLLIAKTDEEKTPAICQGVTKREAFAAALQALGAKQIGGELGSSQQALAWVGSDSKAQLSVLAFSVALRPSAGGLTHSTLPLLVKELLQKEGFPSLLRGSQAFSSWNRFNDNTQLNAWQKPEQASPAELQAVLLSNVPVGESLLSSAAGPFPPLWQGWESGQNQQNAANAQLGPRQKQLNPLPWLQALALAVLLCFCGEILWNGKQGYGKQGNGKQARKKAKVLALLLLPLFGPTPKANAIHLNLVGFAPLTLPIEPLIAEVANRTSIQLDNEAVQNSVLTNSALLSDKLANNALLSDKQLQEPWLWAANIASVSTSEGKLLPQLQTWLRRGGFLIIEGGYPPEALAQLTAHGLETETNAGLWSSIPPDHELMRSFYLLPALPLCDQQPWQGFHFDQRLAILVAPYAFLESLLASKPKSPCALPSSHEENTRIFINMLMVALTTDYKKDQIHLRAILKRLQ